MPKAIRIHKTGDASVLSYDDVQVPAPGSGEVLLRHTAIGVNYADINLRRGTFYLNNPLAMPAILGNEGVGVVEALGPDVTEVGVGDRVAYVTASGTTTSPGSYSERRVIPAKLLAKIPAAISDEQAAAAFVKGLTAWVIVRRMFPVLPGHSVLVHAAAGGVSTFLTQWSRHLGATVIGTVAAGGLRDFRLLRAANRADHGGAEMVRPLGQKRADAAGGRMDQHGMARQHRKHAPHDHPCGEALHESRGRLFVRDRRRDFREQLCCDHPAFAVGTGRRRRAAGGHIGDAVADGDFGHVRAERSRRHRRPRCREWPASPADC